MIGGFVRDLILERPSKDIDIVVIGNGLDLAKACADKLRVKKVSVFERFGTAQFVYKDLEVEFVGARKESYRSDSRKPTIENGTLQDDQNRRDFSINALAISLHKDNFGDLIDPFGGMEDIENEIIRTPLEPAKTYSDDPLRMMRAIRFATQLDFKIERKSLEAISENAHRLEIISQERIMDELNKIILSKTPSRGFKLLNSTKLLHQFFPEMIALQGIETRDGKSHKDNFYHTLEVLDNISENCLIGAVNAFGKATNEVVNQLNGQKGPVPTTGRAYKAAGIPSIVVGDHNYGEGSSREHAAMEPRHLGVCAVIVKSFARIHETNLKKQGMLGLTFVIEADYDKILEDDTFNFTDLDGFTPGKQLTLEVVHADGSKDEIKLNHTYNSQQIGWFRAGSALNMIRKSIA